jgi:hypothetical protein
MHGLAAVRADGPCQQATFGRCVVTACCVFLLSVRLVWSRIWAVLSQYFSAVGCHSNLAVAMYAVDSLRQVSGPVALHG